MMSQPRLLNGLPVPTDRTVLVVPLGGTELVGRNSTLVGYHGRWILIDAGATFAGADDDAAAAFAASHGGVCQQIIADYRMLGPIVSRLSGIVLTHSHEDHVGALQPLFAFQKLWPALAKVPIYATPYTRGIVRRKAQEVGGRPRILDLNVRTANRIGPFDIVPLSVTHSAPETLALAIRTSVGTMVFGSDFKLDPEPLLGRTTDVEALEMLGAAKVMAFLGDSTNARNDGWSTSEGDAMRGISAVMRRATGRVIVSSFASNLARIVGVARAAQENGRILAGAGRSLLANVELAQEIGILERNQARFADNHSIRNADPRDFAMVCTGTQAEAGATLQRLAADLTSGRRGRLCVEAGDTIVHSARVIPGNEASVEALFEIFRAHGVNVLTASTAGETVHASGHAKRSELRELYRLLKPEMAIPVHGDRELLSAHADLAASAGARVVTSPRDGEILSVRPGGAEIIGRVRANQLATIGLGGKHSEKTKLVAWNGGRSPDLVFDSRDRVPVLIDRRPRPDENRGRRPAPQPAHAMI